MVSAIHIGEQVPAAGGKRIIVCPSERSRDIRILAREAIDPPVQSAHDGLAILAAQSASQLLKCVLRRLQALLAPRAALLRQRTHQT